MYETLVKLKELEETLTEDEFNQLIKLRLEKVLKPLPNSALTHAMCSILREYNTDQIKTVNWIVSVELISSPLGNSLTDAVAFHTKRIAILKEESEEKQEPLTVEMFA